MAVVVGMLGLAAAIGHRPLRVHAADAVDAGACGLTLAHGGWRAANYAGYLVGALLCVVAQPQLRRRRPRGTRRCRALHARDGLDLPILQWWLLWRFPGGFAQRARARGDLGMGVAAARAGRTPALGGGRVRGRGRRYRVRRPRVSRHRRARSGTEHRVGGAWRGGDTGHGGDLATVRRSCTPPPPTSAPVRARQFRSHDASAAHRLLWHLRLRVHRSRDVPAVAGAADRWGNTAVFGRNLARDLASPRGVDHGCVADVAPRRAAQSMGDPPGDHGGRRGGAVGLRLTPPCCWWRRSAIGGTFMVLTMAGMQEARRITGNAAPRLIAAMTAAFAIGSVAGPSS